MSLFFLKYNQDCVNKVPEWWIFHWLPLSLPSGSAVKNLPASVEDAACYMDWEEPLEKEMATHSSICLKNPMGRGAWWATVQGGHKRVGHDLVTKQQPLGIPAVLFFFFGIFEQAVYFSSISSWTNKPGNKETIQGCSSIGLVAERKEETSFEGWWGGGEHRYPGIYGCSNSESWVDC